MSRIIVIADTQCRSDVSLEYMSWIGQYVVDKRPDYIVHIGDHYDFPSLSSYDKGTRRFEGRRVIKDIDAGHEGMVRLLEPLWKVQRLQKANKKAVYKPELIFCVGNHEERFDRITQTHPELEGILGVEQLKISEYGWQVSPFLQPVNREGINFAHYLANPFSGNPYGGSALNQLKHVGASFVVGHKQLLDVAIRPTLDGKMQIGIINGAAYPHDEAYKGPQGNNHFRGITVLNEAADGFACPMFVSLDFLRNRYVP